MTKPQTFDGYAQGGITLDCERLLVTLMRGLGPWRDSMVLVGGLTPRYLVPPGPDVPEHAGTQDVDLVVDLEILTGTTEAYHSLEENLAKLGFERATNDKGQRVNWRWEVKAGPVLLRLEFLADMPGMGGRVQPLLTEGNLSALNVPHSAIVFDHCNEAEITAETLGGNGVVTQKFKHADLVAFTVLKAWAFHQRWERKDAHDLVFCLDNAMGPDAVAAEFKAALAGKHAEKVADALGLLRRHFADEDPVEGWTKDGPVAVAKFELGESEADDAERAEARALRQREANYTVESLLKALGS
jgi:hypothetical protein